MKANMVKLAAVSLLALCCVAKADIVELALDCAGVYDSNTPGWTLDFDLGVTFTDISHVYVDWSGEIIAALAAEYSNPDEPFPIDVGIWSYLGSAPNWRHTDFWAGAATYPDPELFDARSEFLYGSMPWSELFDGQGRITIDYTQAILGEGWYIEDGSVDLTSATLVVDGTPVPEPSTLLLLAVGAVYVRAKHRRISRPV
jgi:hypothetical protein